MVAERVQTSLGVSGALLAAFTWLITLGDSLTMIITKVGTQASAAVGGLLFRCSVCPQAFCEDHLPPEALIMGECPRFQLLGHRHPKQGCYLLHSSACVAKADTPR